MKPIKKSDQQKPTLTGCARLHQLLSQAPEAKKEKDNTVYGIAAGTAGFNYIILDGTARTHSENTNELVRAMAACHLGLFADPNNPNRYTPSEDLKNDIENAASSAYSFSKGSSNE